MVDPARLLVTGLSDGLGEPGDVDFGLRGGEVREQGAYRADVPVVANDLRRIAVDAAGVVTHARNGAVFYTGATRAVAPLRAVVVMAPLGAGIDGPRLVAAASSAATITSRRPGTTARPAARDGTGVAVCRHMPDMSSLACPKCGAHSLRLVLKTSWGEYYACAPCQWSIYSTDRAGFVAGSADPLIAAPLPIRTPASGGDTAHA